MEYTITDSTIYIDNYSEEGEMNDSDYVSEPMLDMKFSVTQRHTLENFMEHFSLQDSVCEVQLLQNQVT